MKVISFLPPISNAHLKHIWSQNSEGFGGPYPWDALGISAWWR